MYTATFTRASAAYKRVATETLGEDSSPHHLVELLYQEVLQAVIVARGAILRKDHAAKGKAIVRAIRLFEEGLKPGLDRQAGGALATNLGALYDYCVRLLTQANLKNDEQKLLEVRDLIEPISSAWKEIGPTVGS